MVHALQKGKGTDIFFLMIYIIVPLYRIRFWLYHTSFNFILQIFQMSSQLFHQKSALATLLGLVQRLFF